MNPIFALSVEKILTDAGKQVKGQKRHIIVDTLELLLRAVVQSAAVQDPTGAKDVLGPIASQFPHLRKTWADARYQGKVVQWVWCCFGWILDIVKRPEAAQGFHLLRWRRIVERTFAWLDFNRRLSKDYEFLSDTSETWIYLAMSRLMVRRLAKLRLRVCKKLGSRIRPPKVEGAAK